MDKATHQNCPLCNAQKTAHYHNDHQRDYLQCSVCELVFVPSAQHLSEAEEKAQYDFHENDPDDAGYRKFLSRLADPILERLASGSHGLDFGSGPGPTLSLIFQEAGHDVSLFDIYYANDPSVFNQAYDFITASEVIEHLAKPAIELDRLWSCLKPDGLFGIMTKRVKNKESFENWHYKNDPTHITLFSDQTFVWLRGNWGAELEFTGDDVVIFRKS